MNAKSDETFLKIQESFLEKLTNYFQKDEIDY